MGKLKLASIVFAFAAVSLAVGAGAFSSVSADRGAEVAVVSDDQALLGVEEVDTTGVVDGGPFSVLELTDRGAGSMHVESVSVSSDSIDGPPIEVDSAEIDGSVDVRCARSAEGTPVTLTVAVTGDNVQITKHKDVTVTCNEPEPEPEVEFKGCGNVKTGDGVTVTGRKTNNSGKGNGGLTAVKINGTWHENPNECADNVG